MLQCTTRYTAECIVTGPRNDFEESVSSATTMWPVQGIRMIQGVVDPSMITHVWELNNDFPWKPAVKVNKFRYSYGGPHSSFCAYMWTLITDLPERLAINALTHYLTWSASDNCTLHLFVLQKLWIISSPLKQCTPNISPLFLQLVRGLQQFSPCTLSIFLWVMQCMCFLANPLYLSQIKILFNATSP